MCWVAPKTLDDEDDEDAGDLDYNSQPVIVSMIYQNLGIFLTLNIYPFQFDILIGNFMSLLFDILYLAGLSL